MSWCEAKPGPPAPTKPRLAPAISGLTQNAYRLPSVNAKRKRTSLPTTADRSAAPFQVTCCSVALALKGVQFSFVKGPITLPAASSTSTRSSPAEASALTNRCLPAKRTLRVVRLPPVPPASIEANPSRRSTATPIDPPASKVKGPLSPRPSPARPL